ncbi:MAG: zinc-dependent peptidase [Flavobacterium sp.]|nr:zinc-dependent peptidase [Flavobacterium sp.]
MVLFFATIFLALSVAVLLVVGFFNLVIEPVYFQIFKKPVYVYFYPILKKLPQQQKRILEQEVAFFQKLSDKKKQYFEHRMAEFLTLHQFHGQEGITVTDEMKTMIAASYVMLTFGMRYYLIDVFDKILIYPTSYYSTVKDEMHNGEFNPQYKLIAFSWEHFKEGYEADSDNLNLGIHEFSHALHNYGMKKQNNSAAFFAEMYEQIRKDVKRPANAQRLVDSQYFRIYAFTNEFEFLAVIMEHFFETPQTFRSEFPELYLKVKRMINFTP